MGDMHPQEPTAIRLNRYLAQCGLGSRRHCDGLISSGDVSVNGAVVTELGVKVDPAKDKISFKGMKAEASGDRIYIAFHKAKDTVVTASDPQGRTTVYDALSRVGVENVNRLKYVGRLDRNSEGLLLFTSDGDLVHSLTHPKFGIKKVYQVRTDRPMTEADARTMERTGVASEGQILRAAKIRFIESPVGGREFWVEVDLFEGRNRQIRRMFDALGYDVVRLKRTQFGVIKLGTLKRGAFRTLLEREVKGLSTLGFTGTGAPKKRRKPRAQGHENAQDANASPSAKHQNAGIRRKKTTSKGGFRGSKNH